MPWLVVGISPARSARIRGAESLPFVGALPNYLDHFPDREQAELQAVQLRVAHPTWDVDVREVTHDAS